MSKTMKDFDREGMLTLLKNEHEAHRYILATAIIAFAKLSPEVRQATLDELQRIVEGIIMTPRIQRLEDELREDGGTAMKETEEQINIRKLLEMVRNLRAELVTVRDERSAAHSELYQIKRRLSVSKGETIISAVQRLVDECAAAQDAARRYRALKALQPQLVGLLTNITMDDEDD